METTTVNLGSDWTKVIDASDSKWIIQNTDLSSVYIKYSDTQPGPDVEGIVLQKKRGYG